MVTEVKENRKRASRNKLDEYARQLNRNLPKSEVWFWKEWRALGMKFGDEVRNARFCGTIPDVRSKKYRYIIEIDGKVHADPEVRKNDMRKTALWNRQGYRVFRILAGDKEKLRRVASKIRQLRKIEPVLSDALRRIYEI